MRRPQPSVSVPEGQAAAAFIVYLCNHCCYSLCHSVSSVCVTVQWLCSELPWQWRCSWRRCCSCCRHSAMWPCVLHTGLCTLRCALLGLGLPRAGLCVGGQLDYTAALCHITVVSSLCPSMHFANHTIMQRTMSTTTFQCTWHIDGALRPFYGIVAHQK